MVEMSLVCIDAASCRSRTPLTVFTGIAVNTPRCPRTCVLSQSSYNLEFKVCCKDGSISETACLTVSDRIKNMMFPPQRELRKSKQESTPPTCSMRFWPCYVRGRAGGAHHCGVVIDLLGFLFVSGQTMSISHCSPSSPRDVAGSYAQRVRSSGDDEGMHSCRREHARSTELTD